MNFFQKKLIHRTVALIGNLVHDTGIGPIIFIMMVAADAEKIIILAQTKGLMNLKVKAYAGHTWITFR